MGTFCHTILEEKFTGIQTWLDVLMKPFLPVLQPLASQEETQTLEISPSWARLNTQGEVKTQLPVPNSGRNMDIEALL